MHVRKFCVEPHTCKIAERRTGGDAAKRSEIPNECPADDSTLLVAFPIPEEKHAVATDRAAKGETKLSSLEKRIGICRDRDSETDRPPHCDLGKNKTQSHEDRCLPIA